MHFVGEKASYTRRFEEKDVFDFGVLSNDLNPVHLDKEYAAATRFKDRIVQGPMVASLIGGVVGTYLPGPGSIFVNQNLSYKRPVYIGEEVTAFVEIISIREDKPIIKLRTWIENEKKEMVIEGETVVLFLKDMSA